MDAEATQSALLSSHLAPCGGAAQLAVSAVGQRPTWVPCLAVLADRAGAWPRGRCTGARNGSAVPPDAPPTSVSLRMSFPGTFDGEDEDQKHGEGSQSGRCGGFDALVATRGVGSTLWICKYTGFEYFVKSNSYVVIHSANLTLLQIHVSPSRRRPFCCLTVYVRRYLFFMNMSVWAGAEDCRSLDWLSRTVIVPDAVTGKNCGDEKNSWRGGLVGIHRTTAVIRGTDQARWQQLWPGGRARGRVDCVDHRAGLVVGDVRACRSGCKRATHEAGESTVDALSTAMKENSPKSNTNKETALTCLAGRPSGRGRPRQPAERRSRRQGRHAIPPPPLSQLTTGCIDEDSFSPSHAVAEGAPLASIPIRTVVVAAKVPGRSRHRCTRPRRVEEATSSQAAPVAARAAVWMTVCLPAAPAPGVGDRTEEGGGPAGGGRRAVRCRRWRRRRWRRRRVHGRHCGRQQQQQQGTDGGEGGLAGDQRHGGDGLGHLGVRRAVDRLGSKGVPQGMRGAQRVDTAGEGAADAVHFGVERYGASYDGSGGCRRVLLGWVVSTAQGRRRERWSSSYWAVTGGLIVTSARLYAHHSRRRARPMKGTRSGSRHGPRGTHRHA